MYCKNCGVEMDSGAAICVKCGFKKGQGNKYCQNCGKETSEGQAVCMGCGHSLKAISIPNIGSGAVAGGSVPEDKKVLCGILALLFGIGIHSFILGENKKGIMHLILTFGGFLLLGIPTVLNVIWSFVEGIKIFSHSYVVDPNKWFAF